MIATLRNPRVCDKRHKTRRRDPILALGILGATLLGCADRPSSAPAAVADAVAVVRAESPDRPADLGAAVSLGGCTALTAAHVVEDAVAVTVGPDAAAARLVVADDRVDLALVATGPGGGRLVITDRADGDVVGQPAWIVTAPPATRFSPVTVEAVVSLRQRRLPADVVVERRSLVLTGVDVEPGDSGAPVVDPAGRVVGVVTLTQRAADTSYAVAPSEIRAFLDAADSDLGC